jgi:hypothetical protein
LFNSVKSSEGSIELTTTPLKNLSLAYAMRIGRFGVNPSISLNRAINRNFSVNASTSVAEGGLSDAGFGFVKLFPKNGIRIDFDSRISDSEINNDLILSKDINKKFQVMCVSEILPSLNI